MRYHTNVDAGEEDGKRKPSAAILSASLAESFADPAWDSRTTEFTAAWNGARASAWVERQCDSETEKRLRIQLEEVCLRIREDLQKIVAEKAWKHCFDSMTEHERQHLVAWAQAMRKIGKGKGKYAPRHRREARKHMEECRTAIPAWIMPIYRVAETIRPGSDLFDVVVVDEASQSGPEALFLTYLAKKLVVVGDDKQISPESVGMNREDVNQLRARHIADLPHNDAYGVDNSFFDVAEIHYQGRIRLREHFRCMPEIIQFSNNLCYAAEPLIPLKQYGTDRLSPVVGVRDVTNGYLEGTKSRVINPPEAQAVADEIMRCCRDESYEGKTFGVISLLGHHQARRIEELLLRKLGPQEMERRQIVCGDAYAFQGDERDVIFLSMVSAPMEERRIGTLASARDERRFNVAASRAREQLLLFHTATLNDLSPKCLRHYLLEYCMNPKVEETKVDGRSSEELRRLVSSAYRDNNAAPRPFDSWFEVDVFLAISKRGYRVIPQYEVAGYRIDLVVEGMKGRLAVECDGDRWHGAERFDEDMARQRTLERCGWSFWRVRGSAFYLNPENAMESLWGELDRLGIYSQGREPPTQEQHGRDSAVSSAVDSEETPTTPGVTLDCQALGAQTRRPETDEPTEGDDEAIPEKKVPEPDGEPDSRPTIAPDAPYRSWSGYSPPDPNSAPIVEVIPSLINIIEAQGPMTAQQACRVYVTAAGFHKLGKNLRSALHRALRKALRDGLLEERNERQNNDFDDFILRKTRSPVVLVRPRGNREFVDIPPSEVATVLFRIQRTRPHLSGNSLYREVLNFYEIRRMTRNILSQIRWIDERESDLRGAGPQSIARDEDE